MKQTIETIHIYHTNDIHSHFGSWPQISRLLRDRRHHHINHDESCFVFDIGDFVDRSHPFTEGTAGKGNTHLLNQAGYDAVTIGNNEGITMSKTSLNALYEEANFDIVLSNLWDVGRYPEWAIPSTIYSTKKGTRIGVIGATAEYQAFYSKLGWQMTPPRETLKQVAEELKNEVDIIVCLSHMGIHEDERLAVECPIIDVILGAHTHHLFPEGKFIGPVLLAATGKYGEYVGHVTLQINLDVKKVIERKAILYRTDHLDHTAEDVRQVNGLIDAGKQAMKEQVFFNSAPLRQNLFDASDLSSFFGRALIAYTKADCALFNAGIFLGSIEKGWVTKGDLHALLPHPINPCVVTLNGEQLLEVYEQSLNREWPEIEIKGLGFRGTLMGAMIHERLYQNRSGQLFAGNREVTPGGIYTLATLDMFTFGFFFPSLKEAEKDYYMPELIRDVFGWYGQVTNKK